MARKSRSVQSSNLNISRNGMPVVPGSLICCEFGTARVEVVLHGALIMRIIDGDDGFAVGTHLGSTCEQVEVLEDVDGAHWMTTAA